jgi:GDPmannose 4,6-dehydratase
MKVALITGISGQDGAYLAKFLLKKNYKIIGLDRRSSRDDRWRLNYLEIENRIIFEYSDLVEISSIQRIFNKYKIDEVYNLAAQSFVGSSFDVPLSTCDVNALGVLRILEVIRNKKKKIRFYQASSSEMFGEVLEIPQNENTPLNPQSPYAISKVFGHYISQNYRNSYNMFICSGILFNHESPLRGEEFVTRKITVGLAKIIAGEISCLYLGNIDAKRDWGYAEDYVEAMWLMMQKNKADDYVVATNKTYSVKDFINEAAKHYNLKIFWRGKGKNQVAVNKENNKVIIKIDSKFYRPSEVNFLKGNANKAKKILKWKPKVDFKKLVEIMSKADIKRNLGKFWL